MERKTLHKTLSEVNTLLRGRDAQARRNRSLASSTAIETGESIPKLEKKISHLRRSPHRVTLA